MYKIAVMGDKDSIYGFSSVGIDIFPADAAAAPSILRRLAADEYAVIYMTESLYVQVEKEVSVYHALPLPAIIPIPGVSGNTGVGFAQVKQFVERAVGSDIIFGEN